MVSELDKGIRHLIKVDQKLAVVIKNSKEKPSFSSKGKPFESLCLSIIHQQLAGKAAETIYNRFLGLYGGKEPTPEQIRNTPDEKLRSVGLSKQKISYLKDLSAKVLNNTVEIHRLEKLSNEAIITELTKVKGIGVWTAQMFLMFNLGRLDIFPSGDLGIKNGMKSLYRLREPISVEKMETIAKKWHPYSSLASWYVWRHKDRK